MASKKEQLFALFSLLESHIFLMESFSWVSEGPSPLKETQTVKKIPYNWKKNQRAMVTKLSVVVLSCIIFEMM